MAKHENKQPLGGVRTAASPPGFVGRGEELAAFAAALQRFEEDAGGLLLFTGQPGIGKTRILTEFAAIAEREGALALWGSSQEQEGLPSYWPWIQVVRTLVERAPSTGVDLNASVQQLLALSRRDLAIEHNAESRFELFEGVLHLLHRGALRHPLVLLLDNIHLADTPSLRLLEFVAPELSSRPILIVGAYRDVEISRKHPLADALGRLAPTPNFRRLRLRGLDTHETGLLMREICGHSAPFDVVAALHRQTEGNPLFVGEVVRYLLDEGYFKESTLAQPRNIRVPEGVREAVGQRLNRLSARCNELLGIASVLGREFDVSVLARVAGDFGDAERDACLEEASAAHILTLDLDRPGRFHFSHALIRETLYEELPAIRRIRLHATAASVIEDMGAPSDANQLGILAHHCFHGQLVAGTAKVVEYAKRAAEQATAMMAYEDSARFCRLALDCMEMNGQTTGLDVLETSMHLGEALRQSGDIEGAMRAQQRSIDLADALGSPILFAKAALLFETARWRPGLPGGQSVDFLKRALDQLPPEDSELRARLLFSLSRALTYSTQQDESPAYATRGLDMARRLADPRLLVDALEHTAMALHGQPGRAHDQFEITREQLKVAAELRNPEPAAAAHACYGIAALQLGRMPEFSAAMPEFEALSRRLRQPHYQYQVAIIATMRALLSGDFSKVPDLASRAMQIGNRIRGADAEGVFSIQMFALNRELGLLGELKPVLSALLDGRNELSFWAPGLALLHAEIGDLERAQALMTQVADGGFQSIARDELMLTSLAFLADVCGVTGDRALAATLREQLQPYQGQNVICGPNIVCFGPVDRLLGILSGVRRDWDDAAAYFQGALQMASDLHSRPLTIRVQCDFAAMLLRQETPSAIKQAAVLLDGLAADAARLGLRTLRARAEDMESELRRLASARGFDELTAREIEVLRLMAVGRSNMDISKALSISMPTVATHVRNILSKTDSPNRTAAAAYARERGLVL